LRPLGFTAKLKFNISNTLYLTYELEISIALVNYRSVEIESE